MAMIGFPVTPKLKKTDVAPGEAITTSSELLVEEDKTVKVEWIKVAVVLVESQRPIIPNKLDQVGKLNYYLSLYKTFHTHFTPIADNQSAFW